MERRDVIRTLARGAIGAAIVSAIPMQQAFAGSALCVRRTNEHDASPCANHQLRALWIGHSTVLLDLGGFRIVTDPVLFDAYGLSFLGATIGPRRMMPPAMSVEQLPRPNLILLSHAHMDHMDRPTLRAIAERFPGEIDVITAAKTSDVIDDLDWKSLNEMDWGETASLQNITLKALQVKHNGWRLPGEACRASGHRKSGRSYNGYLIEHNGVRIVFGGDTAYTRLLGQQARNVDLAIMPIGAYNPYPETHCTPEESVAMAQDMKARYFMPIHHSTFVQSQEPRAEPLARLRAAIVPSGLQVAAATAGQGLLIDLQ
jgi:L-ascorbate metabolism protein UlaG (beta-lactamase superfamily)